MTLISLAYPLETAAVSSTFAFAASLEGAFLAEAVAASPRRHRRAHGRKLTHEFWLGSRLSTVENAVQIAKNF